MDENGRVRQGQTLPLRPRSQQHGRSRGCHAQTDRLNIGTHVIHGVVDRRHRGEGATGRVDVHADLAIGIHRLQAQQLSHHGIGDVVGHRGAEEDDAVLEQLGVRVDTTHAVGGAFLPLRDVVVVARTCRGQPTRSSLLGLLGVQGGQPTPVKGVESHGHLTDWGRRRGAATRCCRRGR